MHLSFASLDSGVMSISGAGDTPIQRFRNFYDGQVGNPQRPQTGWYWNPAQPGSGIAVEGLGGAMFAVLFGYDASGHAQWTAAQGSTGSPQFAVAAAPVLYADGQSLTGGFRQAAVVGQPIGSVSFMESTPHVLTVSYPSGFTVNYLRFRFLD
jgi:hypothetical protein